MLFIAHTTSIHTLSIFGPQLFAAQPTGLSLVLFPIQEFIFPIQHIVCARDWIGYSLSPKGCGAFLLEHAKSSSGTVANEQDPIALVIFLPPELTVSL